MEATPSGGQDSSEDDVMFNIHTGSSSPPMLVKLEVNQKPVQFEVDTGATVTVIDDRTLKSVFPHMPLSKSNIVLNTYTGEICLY